MGKEMKIIDCSPDGLRAAIIEKIDHLNDVRGKVYELLTDEFGFENIDRHTLKTMVKYYYEFGPYVLYNWFSQAYMATKFRSVQDFGKYISGIRRATLEANDKNHHMGLS